MANAFQTDLGKLEEELAKLITESVISARIDSHNKRLVARQVEERNATFNRTNEIGNRFQVSTKALLLRVNLVRAGMTIKPNKGGEGGGGAKRKKR